MFCGDRGVSRIGCSFYDYNYMFHIFYFCILRFHALCVPQIYMRLANVFWLSFAFNDFCCAWYVFNSIIIFNLI